MSKRRLYWNPSDPTLIAALLFPVLIFYAVLAWKFVPLPSEDDYSSMLGFALKWNALHDWPHKLLLVFTNQHNEYKMPLTFGLQAIELGLTHHVHIGAWMWLGNLMPLALLVPLWCGCRPDLPTRERLVFFVPVVWLIMNLGYAEAMNFALTGFQALNALTWSVASILMLSRTSLRANLSAIPMALLACGTNANALLLAPVGFMMLLRRKSWPALAAWTAAFALQVAVYFYRYTTLPHPRPHVLEALRYFFGTAGASFGFHTYATPAILAGIAMVALFAFLISRGTSTYAPFAFWATVWLVLTFAMITYGRSGVAPDSFLVSRYKINCDLFLALLYLQALELWRAGRMRLPDRKLAMPLTAAFLVLFVAYSAGLGWYRLMRRERDVRYGMSLYLQSGGTVSPMTYPPPQEPWMYRPGIMENARTLLNAARAQDLYQIPAHF